MSLTNQETDQRIQMLNQRFADVISAHVVTISDNIYRRYSIQANIGENVIPDDKEGSRNIDNTPRTEWASENVTSYFSEEAYNSMRTTYQASEKEIGRIGDDTPVYFAEKGGIYYMRDPQTRLVLEVWLTWPSYPLGWD